MLPSVKKTTAPLVDRWWRPRRIMAAVRQRRLALPAVHVYPSPGMDGMVHKVRGLHLPNCTGCFDSAADHGVYTPLLLQRFKQLQRLEQLRQQHASERNRSATAAELFVHFLPAYMLPYGPVSAADLAAINSMPDESFPREARFAIVRSCRRLLDEGNLTLLTAANRHRHFVIPFQPLWCDYLGGRPSGLNWAPPPNHVFWGMEMDNIHSSSSRKYQVQIPFLGGIRWSVRWDRQGRTPPWRAAHLQPHRRTVLMSFTGSISGSPEGKALRRAVVNACNRQAGPQVCTTQVAHKTAYQAPEQSRGASARLIRDLLALKQRSVFCIEPPGSARIRKALVDAFLCGCIPVIFITEQELASLWPLHLQPWGRNATVRLDAEAVMSGKLDVVRTLRLLHGGHDLASSSPDLAHPAAAAADTEDPLGGSLPVAPESSWGASASVAVRRMQAVIARHAHRLHYSLDGLAHNDAADLTIKAMQQVVSSRAQCERIMPGSWRCARAAGI
jgi:hypothetical protein